MGGLRLNLYPAQANLQLDSRSAWLSKSAQPARGETPSIDTSSTPKHDEGAPTVEQQSSPSSIEDIEGQTVASGTKPRSSCPAVPAFRSADCLLEESRRRASCPELPGKVGASHPLGADAPALIRLTVGLGAKPSRHDKLANLMHPPSPRRVSLNSPSSSRRPSCQSQASADGKRAPSPCPSSCSTHCPPDGIDGITPRSDRGLYPSAISPPPKISGESDAHHQTLSRLPLPRPASSSASSQLGLGDCADTIVGGECPSGHPLHRVTDGLWDCDCCRREIATSFSAFVCDACDFALCQRCLTEGGL